MNQYPLWRYLLVLGVLLVGGLLALPNIYGSAPAVQIGQESGAPLPEGLSARFESALSDADLAATRAYENEGRLFFLFDSIDTQVKAYDVLNAVAGDDYITAQTLASQQPGWLRSLGLSPMSLGLDLRGGVYLRFEVDLAAAIDKRLDVYVDEFELALTEAGITRRVTRSGDAVRVQVRDDEDLAPARRLIRDLDNQLQVADGSDQRTLLVSMTDAQIAERQNFAIEQNITTLRNRVNALGVAEPVIQRQGLNRIVVQLPGIQDPARAIDVLGATATLEFRLVDQTGSGVGSQRFPRREGGELLLQRQIIASGDQIIDASAGFSEGQPAVNIRLDALGGARMLETTKKNIDKPMAVLFIETFGRPVERDGETVIEKTTTREVINDATIRGVFSTNFQITGLTPGEARDLALLLKAGALAAPLFLVEERTIGPSLGQDNIDRGFRAVQIGFIAVVIFMIIYYKVFGLIANLALLTNLVLITGLLSLLQASLTLPGIAGIVLTVGMAVDANVLIFERIREELDNKNTPQGAIALVLFTFGTGPIKGFAVTLALGIMTSMFTAIIGTRAVVNLLYGGRKITTVPV